MLVCNSRSEEVGETDTNKKINKKAVSIFNRQNLSKSNALQNDL